MIAHGLIQTARGHVTDEDYELAQAVLAQAVEAAKDVEAERDRLREAIIEHRCAIEAAGDVYVSRVESARAAALKHKADQVLWASAPSKEIEAPDGR